MNEESSYNNQVGKTKKRNILGDSVLLSVVRIVTIFAGMAQTMILARTLTKELYGTFSQTLLVYSFIAPLLSLGLDSTINYFFNKTDNQADKEKAINAIFFLTIVTGIVGAVLMMGAKKPIARFFSNPELMPLIIYICIRPLLTNLIALYQPLYISLGYTKIIAIRSNK
jgi:O-antigen/teichoic acid export membrane protein